MLNIVLPILFFLSLVSFLYFVLKNIPALAQIPLESLPNKESFFGFLWRMIKTFFGIFRPKKIKIYFLTIAEKVLLRFKETVSKTNSTLEELSRSVSETSRKERWEHHWFAHDTKKKKEDVKSEEVKTEVENKEPDQQ